MILIKILCDLAYIVIVTITNMTKLYNIKLFLSDPG
jgi:hypothetical protein